MVFVASIVAAFDPIVWVGEDIHEALRAPRPLLEDFILPALVKSWTEARTPFVLVLDNLERMTGERSHSALRHSSSRIALATRIDPRLPIASLRAASRSSSRSYIAGRAAGIASTV